MPRGKHKELVDAADEPAVRVAREHELHAVPPRFWGKLGLVAEQHDGGAARHPAQSRSQVCLPLTVQGGAIHFSLSFFVFYSAGGHGVCHVFDYVGINVQETGNRRFGTTPPDGGVAVGVEHPALLHGLTPEAIRRTCLEHSPMSARFACNADDAILTFRQNDALKVCGYAAQEFDKSLFVESAMGWQ